MIYKISFGSKMSFFEIRVSDKKASRTRLAKLKTHEFTIVSDWFLGLA